MTDGLPQSYCLSNQTMCSVTKAHTVFHSGRQDRTVLKLLLASQFNQLQQYFCSLQRTVLRTHTTFFSATNKAINSFKTYSRFTEIITLYGIMARPNPSNCSRHPTEILFYSKSFIQGRIPSGFLFVLHKLPCHSTQHSHSHPFHHYPGSFFSYSSQSSQWPTAKLQNFQEHCTKSKVSNTFRNVY